MTRRILAGVALAVSLSLAGCASSPELTVSAADRLQQQVLAVTTAAAEGRYADARAALEVTVQDLEAAVDAEEVSPTRYREILAAVRLVRADLEAAAAAAAAAEQAQREAELQQQLEAQQQAAAEAAAAQQAAEEAAAQEAANGNEGGGNGDDGGGNGDEGGGNGDEGGGNRNEGGGNGNEGNQGNGNGKDD
ncbi:hypothetical protein [Naasia sp. SYSU D00948]|uniref:hypothetical protein n=1 Tax=Naasia sp. SYSU D00948 TaxID=2817379 RepID=UPI001B30EFEF|nr:hypothetical protein [Naasia sp. SYSU D00948]